MKAPLKLSILFVFCLIMAGKVFAHGNTEPQHGGIVKVVGEYTFELVRQEKLIEVYVNYEGEEVKASDIHGILKIKRNKDKKKIPLQSGQNNRLFTNQGISDGSTVLVMITLADGFSKIVAKYKL